MTSFGDHLWQSTLFAAVAGLLTLAFRQNRAQVRYWLWLAASLKFLVPFAWLLTIGSQFGWRSSALLPRTDVAVIIDSFSQPFSRPEFIVAAVASPAPASPRLEAVLPSLIFGRFTAADKERQLEEALMLENPITEITIAMEVNYFQLSRAEYFVPVAVKIPGSELALARRRVAARTEIDFIGEVKDDTASPCRTCGTSWTSS